MGLVSFDLLQSVQKAANTAPGTSAEKGANVFSANQNDQIYNNKASTTVIASEDYSNHDIDGNKAIQMQDDMSMDDILHQGYGKDKLDEGEKNSAAWSVVDNNRWMINDINQTYLAAQVANELMSAYTKSGQEFDENTIAEYTSEIIGGNFDIEARNLPNGFSDKINEMVEKVNNNGYDQFDRNVRTDQIPPELIKATSFVKPDDVDKVFCPNLNSLEFNGDYNDEQLSQTVSYDSKDKTITLDKAAFEGKTDEEQRQYLQNQIAENYGVIDSNKDGAIDLTSSYAGVAILSALVKEEGNNKLFDKLDEDPNAIMDALVTKAKEDGLTLYCPDTEVNVLGSGFENEEDLKAFLQQEDSAGEITYIHALQDSLKPNINELTGAVEPLTGEDILNAYEFNGKTLADLAKEGSDDDKALALSAFKQIVSNNPEMAALAFGERPIQEATIDDLETILGANFADIAQDQGGEIVLENIEYILAKKPEVTPTYYEPDSVPENPSEPSTPEPTTPEPTTPEPTTPEPTTPEPTTPEPTTPEPTTPEPTTPEPTTPEPTTPSEPPTECPDNPDVDPADKNLPNDENILDDPPVTEPPIDCGSQPDADPDDTNLPKDENISGNPPIDTPSETQPDEPAPPQTEAPAPPQTEAPAPPQTEAPAPTCPPIGTSDNSSTGDNNTKDDEWEL